MIFLYDAIHTGVGKENKNKYHIKYSIKSYFQQPFQDAVYGKHLKSQHPFQWETYSVLSKDQKTTLFDKNDPVVHWNTIKSYFGEFQAHVHHFINKCIVDIFVGEIIFHTNNSNDDITKEQSLAIFEDVVGYEEVSPDSYLDKDFYLIIRGFTEI